MVGTNLMCFWHAAYIKDDGSQSSGLKQRVLKAVVKEAAAAAGSDAVYFSPADFNAALPPDQTPSYETFVDYFYRPMTTGLAGVTYDQAFIAMEKACWAVCVEAYQPRMVYFEEDQEHLWQIFNRLAEEGSYPPVAHEAEVTWLTGRIASGLGVPTKLAKREIDRFPDAGMTFQAVLDYLENTYFTTLALTSRIHDTITDIHTYCVRQVLRTGWLYKRTKKQANWTNWQRRFFVHEPGKLTYYEDDKRVVKKGKVPINANCKVENLETFKTLFKNLSGRFKLTVSASYEIEMAANDDNQRRLWIASIQDNALAVRDAISPLQQQIRDRRRKLSAAALRLFVGGTPPSSPPISGRNTPTSSGRNTPVSQQSTPTPPASANVGMPVNWKTVTTPNGTPNQYRRRSSNSKFLAPFAALAPMPADYSNPSEDLECSVDYERTKIEAIFLRIDKDGNGRIHAAEFKEFLRSDLHLDMDDKEIDLVFSTIDKRCVGCVGFDDFYSYFIHFVLEAQSSEAEDKIRAAFLQADRSGTGTIDFGEFCDFIWARKQSITGKRIADIFGQMDVEGTGEVNFDEFRSFLNHHDSFKYLVTQNSVSSDASEIATAAADTSLFSSSSSSSPPPTPASATSTTSNTNTNQLEERLRNMYDNSDASDIVTYLRHRWQTLANFKRFGSQGDVVLTGGSGMVADVLPGEYTLLDLACFNDLPPIVPHHVKIKGVQWVSSTIPELSGKLIFPEHFDGRLPVEIASSEHLAYYGCSLADSSQMKVALLYRHGIQDFTYQNNYLDEYVKDEKRLGGGGLEHHDFSHLDCPLEDDSGYFVIGKLVNQTELHLTGFKVPTRHTLYLPSHVIHSNDYLRGTWRTMLTDEVDIDHVHMVRSRRIDARTDLEHFVFSFYSRWPTPTHIAVAPRPNPC